MEALPQPGELNAETGQPDQREAEEAQWNGVAGRLAEQESKEIERIADIEFARSEQARAEAVGELGHAQIGPAGNENVEQDLEAFG